MIEEAEALASILAEVPPFASEEVSLCRSAGRFSVREILATVDLPGFDNSAMDGYAVRSGDAVVGARLDVTGEQAAGGWSEGLRVGGGEAVRIFTGAALPGGADAVVMQEDVSFDPALQQVTLAEAASPGEFVRRRGGDVCRGQVLVKVGDRITPQKVGVLASQGLAAVTVGMVPTVAVVSTGDELVDPGEALGQGQIYNSNATMLEAFLRGEGFGSVARFHARDDPADCHRILCEARDAADVVIVSGGVSVGAHDHVKLSLEMAGFESGFWRVRLKPGKPFLFGRHTGGNKIAFGLPGNPVSSFVTFAVLVVPALRTWCGAGEAERTLRTVSCTAETDLTNLGDRPEYVRGKIDPENGAFDRVGLQRSHALFGLSQADALVRLGAGETAVTGAPLRALVF